jgi:hypothetical protein
MKLNNTLWSYEFIEDDIQEWWIYDSLGYLVATLSGDEANAQLIAAVPDLFEACIYARDEMVVKTEGENGAYMALEDAIALATTSEGE